MSELIVRHLSKLPYMPVFEAMKEFTQDREPSAADEIWFLEHEPVYTQGRAGKPDYLLNTGDIPVVKIDRGGQVTYHGPGQLTAYLLIDLKRRGIGVRDLVTIIETVIVSVLKHWGIDSAPRADAPGVYVDGAKIAALGLRISKGCSYHGLNFNLQMDMAPWAGINPCGLGVPITQLSDVMGSSKMPEQREIRDRLRDEFVSLLGYNDLQNTDRLPSQLAI